MTMSPKYDPPADDAPVDDVAEQRQPASVDPEDAGLDLDHVGDLLQRDANPSDVVEQAIVVALPDDDRDAEAD
jgi:hypothetical protein